MDALRFYPGFGLVLMSLCFCGPRGPGEEIDIGATVVYGFGRIELAGRPLLAGDEIAGGSQVEVGKRSLASLQLGRIAGRVSLLVRENSRVQLRARSYDGDIDYTPLLIHGKLILKIEDLPGSERVLVDAPGIQIEVRGTQFSIFRSAGDTQVDVVKGAVRVRPRLAWLERIPTEVRERSEVLRSVARSLDRVAVPVAAGQRGSFNGRLAERVARSVPELERLSRNPRFQSAESAAEARRLGELIDGDLIAMDFADVLEREFAAQRSEWAAKRALEKPEGAAVEAAVFRWETIGDAAELDDSHCKTRLHYTERLNLKNGSTVEGCILAQLPASQGRPSVFILLTRSGDRREIPYSLITRIDYPKKSRPCIRGDRSED